jgi:hypothetical protein
VATGIVLVDAFQSYRVLRYSHLPRVVRGASRHRAECIVTQFQHHHHPALIVGNVASHQGRDVQPLAMALRDDAASERYAVHHHVTVIADCKASFRDL